MSIKGWTYLPSAPRVKLREGVDKVSMDGMVGGGGVIRHSPYFR